MKRLIIASSNKNKISEIKQLFKGIDIQIEGIEMVLGYVPEVIEDCDTFRGNAEKKAIEMSRLCESYVLSDDSGLVVEELEGRPGIYSARYAGKGCTFKDNINKVMKEMQGIENRVAKFVCVLSLAHRDKGIVKSFYGEIIGEIIATEHNFSYGFGYDPIFRGKGFEKTFSEMLPKEKNAISHRSKALKKFLSFIKNKYNVN